MVIFQILEIFYDEIGLGGKEGMMFGRVQWEEATVAFSI
jgi:hypothetical protein